MLRKYIASLFFSLMVVISLTLTVNTTDARPSNPGQIIAKPSSAGPLSAERTFQFTYVTKVTMPENGQDATVHIPVPRDNNWQSISNLQFNAPADAHFYHDPDYGNKIARFELSADPGVTKTIIMTFRVRRTERSLEIPDELETSNYDNHPYYGRYTKHHQFMETNNRVKKIASNTVDKSKSYAQNIRSLYERVMGMMSYDKSGQGWGRGDISYCINVGKGNCTDFHTLFDSIAREKGIPAEFIMGFPIPRTTNQGTVGGYHCWTEVYVPNRGWMALDISEADKHPDLKEYYFGTLDADRVTMTVGKNIQLSSGKRVNYLVYPVVESNGEASVKKEFSFRNINVNSSASYTDF